MLARAQMQFFVFARARFFGGIRSSVFLRRFPHSRSVQRTAKLAAWLKSSLVEFARPALALSFLAHAVLRSMLARDAQQGAAPDRLPFVQFWRLCKSAAGELGRSTSARSVSAAKAPKC